MAGIHVAGSAAIFVKYFNTPTHTYTFPGTLSFNQVHVPSPAKDIWAQVTHVNSCLRHKRSKGSSPGLPLAQQWQGRLWGGHSVILTQSLDQLGGALMAWVGPVLWQGAHFCPVVFNHWRLPWWLKPLLAYRDKHRVHLSCCCVPEKNHVQWGAGKEAELNHDLVVTSQGKKKNSDSERKQKQLH